jgi:hypothetical protein
MAARHRHRHRIRRAVPPRLTQRPRTGVQLSDSEAVVYTRWLRYMLPVWFFARRLASDDVQPEKSNYKDITVRLKTWPSSHYWLPLKRPTLYILAWNLSLDSATTAQTYTVSLLHNILQPRIANINNHFSHADSGMYRLLETVNRIWHRNYNFRTTFLDHARGPLQQFLAVTQDS